MFISRYKTFAIVLLATLAVAGTFLAFKSPSNHAQTAPAGHDVIRRGQLSADLKPMDLPAMVRSADKIFRGTLVSSKPGTVEAGGGTLSVVTYRFKVDEGFYGSFNTIKDIRFTEITMLGKSVSKNGPGAAEDTRLLPEMPKWIEGESYLIFATKPSRVGLSAPVGLGQGSFRIANEGKQETALNQFHNRNLSSGRSADTAGKSAARTTGDLTDGKLAYGDLADMVRAEISRQGGTK